jgi:hypothetical protein
MTKYGDITRTGKGSACSLCGNESNDCGHILNTGAIFCYGYQSARKLEKILGVDGNVYVCTRESRGHTATFMPDNSKEWTEEKQRECRENAARLAEKAKQEKQQRIANELSPVERDKYYRQILDQLTLTDSDYRKLLERGYSPEQIKRGYFRSVKPYQRVRGNYPKNLPGIINGNTLNVFSESILVPTFNKDGLIEGIQYRLNNPPLDKNGKPQGRYRWLSSRTKKNPSGIQPKIKDELPVGVYEPIGQENITAIYACEGFIKPSLARYKLNQPFIGCSGGIFTASQELTKEALNYLSEKYKTKLVLLPIDAGDILNSKIFSTQNIDNCKWIRNYHFIKSLGYECKFLWWGQFTTNHHDIDELDDFSLLQEITLDELLKIHKDAIATPSQDSIAGNNVEAFTPQPTNKPENNNNGLADLDWQRWLNSRKFTPQITINSPDFYFPKGFDKSYQIPNKNAIMSVKSCMGSGKTKALLEVIKSSPNRAFLLGCLNNLLFQTISRGMNTGIKIYHLHDDDALEMNLVKDEKTHLACCIDSMHHLDGYFRGVDLYIDEVDSVIKHIISGGTLGDKQAYTMKVFEKAILECNRVFLLDANNSDLLTDFIAKLAPGKQVVKIENTAKPQKQHFKFVNGYDPEKDAIKQRDKSPLIKMMCESGINPFIASDSRGDTEGFRELLQQENKQGFALNRNTVNDDEAKLFMNNPDSFLQAKQLDFFAISPTANSGVSITTTAKFTHKFSIFVGVLTTNQQTQIMMRLRPYLEHYVYCPKFSTIRNGEKAKTPANYRDNIIQKIILSANLADDKSTQSMAEIIANRIAKAKDDPWFELSCQLGALDNYERENLRKCLMYALQEQGHTVEEIDLEISKQHNQKYDDAKDAVLTNYATEVLKAEAFPDIQEANKIAKSNPKKEVMRRVEKTRLLDRLPGIDSTEAWGVDFVKSTLKDREFITRHQRFWMLNNTEISRKRSEVNWFYKATEGQFYLGSMAKDAHLKIWALQQLNVLQFLDGQEYHKDSIEVVNFYSQARENRDIKLALGVELPKPTVKGNERIKFLKDCLAAIGVPFKSIGRKMINGTRKYCYSVDIEEFNSTERLEIVNAIDRKFSGYLLSESVKKVDWENQVTSEEISSDMQQQTQIVTLEDIDWVEASISNIRLALEDNSWEMVSNVFADIQDRGISKLEVWKQLTLQEQSQIKQLQPKTIEGEWAKYLLDTEKTNNQDQLNNAIAQFNQSFRNVATPDQLACLCEYLPRKLVEKLTA